MEWIDKFSSKSETIHSKFEQISDFFQNCFCSFVIHDLQKLLERYLKESRISFSRLAPDLSRFLNDNI